MNYAISANRLTDGIVIFLAPHGWVEDLASAERFNDQATADRALDQRAKPALAGNLLVDPAVFAIKDDGGRVAAAHIREAIRAKGPTVRPDLGKQAG
jgi:sulfite reductase (NADPH) hemoprotein beta-component